MCIYFPSQIRGTNYLLLGSVVSSSKLLTKVVNLGDENAKLEPICPQEELGVCFFSVLIRFTDLLLADDKSSGHLLLIAKIR